MRIRLLMPFLLIAVCNCHFVPDVRYRIDLKADPGTVTPLSIPCLQESQTYRSKAETWSSEPLAEGGSDFALGVIEFRDNGTAWSPDQYRYILNNVRRLAVNDDGAILVVFAHGWKNNARQCNGNVSCFREVLRFLALAEREKVRRASNNDHPIRPRHVIGVYLGWRGDQIDQGFLSIPRQFTFWSRKNAAYRVGHGICRHWDKGSCLDPGGVRAAIDELAHVYDAMQEKRKDSRLVVVGHSFGAQVVFAALRDRLAESLRRDEVVQGLGSLAVLVNPAFEASQFETLDDLIHQRKFDEQQKPLLVTVSTTNDLATHLAFPVGQFVSPTVRWRSRKWLATIGNYPPYHTHTLTKRPPNPNTFPAVRYITLTPPTQQCDVRDGTPDCGCESDLRTTRIPIFTHVEVTPGGVRLTPASRLPQLTTSRICQDASIGDAMLHSLPACVSGSPLLNISTDRSIINGHSGIFNKEFIEFLEGLILAHDQDQSTAAS